MNFMANESAQKLRGGYYTPDDLAVFLCRWVLEIGPTRVLEPSCGDGSFLRALGKAGADPLLSVLAMELNEEEAAKAASSARETGLLNCRVQAGDFLSWALQPSNSQGPTFDAVIGNPPFVRYQYLPAQFQERAEQVFRAHDLPFTKHTNAWVPFIIASLSMLRPGGRLAMVVPSELIHVMHAQSLRTYLGKECRRLVVVDPEQLWFEGTLQGAVLLLAEKHGDGEAAGHTDGLGIYEVRDREFLSLDPKAVFSKPQAMNGRTVSGKWTKAFLAQDIRDLLDELQDHKDIFEFNKVAKVEVGIVTGANKFFLVTDETVISNELQQWAYPMFGRSEHCPGIIYDQKQHLSNASRGKPTNFLWFPDNSPMKYKKARSYIEAGEKESLHNRYKCRIRSPWYTVPSVYSTEIGMLKRSHDTPRLILNKLGAYTTDTAYRIRSLPGISAQKLVAGFVNSLTSLSAELEGRHYGGGVLELVPSEIRKLMIPVSKKTKIDIADLDRLIRQEPMDVVLKQNSARVLGDIGLSSTSQEMIFDGWRRLRNRRHRSSSDFEDVNGDLSVK